MAGSSSRKFPQYLSRPFQVLWFEVDELAIFLFTLTVALVYGGMAWIADFPDAANFYGPILGCSGAVPGGWNWSWYCNEAIDKRAGEADAIDLQQVEQHQPQAALATFGYIASVALTRSPLGFLSRW